MIINFAMLFFFCLMYIDLYIVINNVLKKKKLQIKINFYFPSLLKKYTFN